ncbi:MAG: acyl-CoA thioesterase [Micromonosporaceae bacterium]
MDAYGHVNNARFLTLYEEARAALLFLGAGKVGVPGMQSGLVVARHEIDYLRPIDYGDPVRIELWVEEIRPSRFLVAYELFDDGELASRARTVLVPYDLTNGRPRRLAAPEREFLETWRDASPG